MINGRVLLDGAFRHKTNGAPHLTKITNEKWRIRYNGYIVYIEMTPEVHNQRRNFDITIYDKMYNVWDHCIIGGHTIDRYKQRWTKTGGKINALVDIVKTILDRTPKFSTCCNRVYYKDTNKTYKAFAYEMLEDNIIFYKTFFPKPKTQCK